MTRGAITSQNYDRLRKAVARELMAGAERVRRSYREEIVRTTWNIGKILRGTLGFEDGPSAGNAALIARLSSDLDRPDSFFYDAAKFHRVYPVKAPVALSWSHYSLLIRLEDPRKRLALETKAIAQDLSVKALRMFTRALTKPGFESPTSSKPGFEFETGFLPVERGELYHYRAANAPSEGRVLIDIGFGIERDVRCDAKGSLHSGLIVRAEKSGEDYDARIAAFDKTRLYTYAAALVRVIDGDTLVARVDLGFRTWKTETFRLRGIDAPELTCAAGQKAKAEVLARLAPCSSLVIKTYKQEKYGRFLADVFYNKAMSEREQILREGIFLNQELLEEGLAVPYLFP